MAQVDWVTLTLRALLDGELDEHPLMPEVKLYFSRRWTRPVALMTVMSFLASCAHHESPTEPSGWLLTGEAVPGSFRVVKKRRLPSDWDDADSYRAILDVERADEHGTVTP